MFQGLKQMRVIQQAGAKLVAVPCNESIMVSHSSSCKAAVQAMWPVIVCVCHYHLLQLPSSHAVQVLYASF